PMGLRTLSVGANMVGAGVSSSWALLPSKLAFVGTMRFSDVELLRRLYGSASEYVAVPRSQDGAGRLLYRFSPTGRLALLYLGSGDRVGVMSSVLNYRGRYERRSATHFGALQFQNAIAGRLAVKGQLSTQLYHSDWSYGPIGLGEHERQSQGGL